MLLLTDGTVMCQDSDKPHWWRLTPDGTGSYVNGTWSQLADSSNGPLYFASAVLRDGRVFVAGGEYNNGNVVVDLLAAEIYDPVANKWVSISTPPGWTHIGDASCCVLPDGRVLIGSIDDNRCAIYDPIANSWSAAGSKHNRTSNEETWTLLPDQTVMTVDCAGAPQTEKFVIALNQWSLSGNTPTNLVESSSIEIGPAVLLPDGRLFAIGATGQTALYTPPPVSAQLGSWAQGPVFPPQAAGQTLGAKDAPACLMPNGLVLCAAGPVDGVSGHYLTPTYFFEFNPATNTLTPAPNPPTNGGPPYLGRLMLLPTGQALFANGSNNMQVYTPSGSPDPVWKPTITSAPTTVQIGSTHVLAGRQINGLSQAVSYGDDATMATNYPIVRIHNDTTGHITYCRTFNHSTLGVNTGTVIHTTEFTVPAGTPLGASHLTVVANGIASDPVPVNIVIIKLKEAKELKHEVKELEVAASGVADDTVGSGLMRVIAQLAQRLDDMAAGAEQNGQRPFIRASERPRVGIDIDVGQPTLPPSRPRSQRPQEA
ncbi:MAG: hypothetical protein JO143_04170 [Acetobacteraceae bacterium]|nr:hypothetical protein [Acetobacteraceae bacterium]